MAGAEAAPKDIDRIFLQTAILISKGEDGPFTFTCPVCGGYAIGTRKQDQGTLVATCNGCGSVVREKNLTNTLKKGA